jgi:hypothetical protein
LVGDAPVSVRVALVTAQDSFPASELTVAPQRVAEWIVMHDDVRRAVADFATDEDRHELFAMVPLTEPGTHVIGVATQPRFIEWEAEGFQSYLEKERAKAALDDRARRGMELRTGRERSAEFAKTIVRVEHIERIERIDRPDRADRTGSPAGEPASAGTADRSYRHALGQMLEIVPLTDPTLLEAGEFITVRVVFDTDPTPGVYVSSGREGGPAHEFVQTVRTNEHGVARLMLDRPGHWFLRTHVIRPIDAAKAPDGADWESFRATLTFRVAPTAEPAAGPKDSRNEAGRP